MTGERPTSRPWPQVDVPEEGAGGRGTTLQHCADRILRRDEHLFHAGNSLQQTYLVVAGCLKSYVLHEDGEEQILDFHQPGDIVGIEAMLDQPAHGSVVALDTSSVRRFSAPELRDTVLSGATDGALVLASMYRAMHRLTHRLHMVARPTGQRLARYLLEFADAQGRRGCSRRQLRLPMRRRDLACYLGLATETLSRTFTRLQQQGLIVVDSYEVTLIDLPGLRRKAGLDVANPAARRAGGAATDFGQETHLQPHHGSAPRIHSLSTATADAAPKGTASHH